VLVSLPWPVRLAAQGTGTVFKPEEIEQLVAPIALYPDSLVSQILMASTYPLEVVEAARWAKANTSLKGDALTTALEKQTWDPSVKSLVNFPQVLDMMNQKLDSPSGWATRFWHSKRTCWRPSSGCAPRRRAP
jgi:hypothetical protein